MKSVDAETRKAMELQAWVCLTGYVGCDETAADGPKLMTLCSKWGRGNRVGSVPLPPGTLEKLSSSQLLEEGNKMFGDLVPLPAKRRFEVCAMREPVLCACARRAGDAWLAARW